MDAETLKARHGARLCFWGGGCDTREVLPSHTPEQIEEYLGYFDPDFVGLYGTLDELQPVMDTFSVTVLRADEGETIPGYAITHTTLMFVIDREGYLRLRLHHGSDVKYLVRDLRYILRGRYPK